MRLLAVIFGIVLIFLVALDGFETIILPRRVTRRFRLTLFYYRTALLGWNLIANRIRSSSRRESFRGYTGPLSFLGLIIFWAMLFVLGFGLMMWGLAIPLGAPDKPVSFLSYLYLSGTTFFTLGLGDIIPEPGVGRIFVVSEVALGFIFLALVVSYVPILYQAFSRRELRISLLDARAGSPPTAVELLRRNWAGQQDEELRTLLHDWEAWCADILESHLSYPVLAFYRSQHEQQSWVEALTVILDTCALILTSMDGAPVEAAKFTFAMARHAVVDLAQILTNGPNIGVDRLSSVNFTQLWELLRGAGLYLQDSTSFEQNLAELRATYEPFVSALAGRIQVALPPWIPPVDALDDWQTTAWDELFPSIQQTLRKVFRPQ